MKPIIKRFAVVSSVAAASVGSLFVQTLTNAGSLPNSENGFSSDSTIKTVYTETVDTADNKVVDIFDNKAIAITGLDVYTSAEEGAEVVGKLEEKNIADVISNEDGMTLVQSGNVKGYVKSENLVIGDEAEAVAYNLGNVTASVKADNTELYAKDKKETVKVVSTAENQLVVQLDDNGEALVNTDQVDVDFGLETGKTSSEIAAEEAAKKAAEEAEEAEAAKTAAEEETTASSSYSGSSVNGPYASHLTRSAGVFSGPSGRETYYNLNMNGVVRIMRSLGYSESDGWVYWVREDGVKMFGNYVMVAADLSRRPKGTILECSLGTAIVVDTGSFVASNPNQLDIAVAW